MSARRSTREEGDRNRRMFSSLRSSLGAPAQTTQGPPRTRNMARKEKEMEQVEKLESVDEIIGQLSDMSIRCDRSAMQIKRNIENCSFLEKMNEDEWEKLCDTLCECALNETEKDFAVDVFGSLLKHSQFCNFMCEKLARLSAEYIMKENERGVPAMLGSLLCANWRRGATRATEASNPLLFTAISIVQGWLVVINTERKDDKKQERSNDIDGEECHDESISSLESGADESGRVEREGGTQKTEGESADEEEHSESSLSCEDEEEEGVHPEIVNRCAVAVSELCACTQRSLWMKWPTLCDEIYAAIKPAITHSTILAGDTKASLLSTLISLHMWTRAKAPTTTTAATQTAAK